MKMKSMRKKRFLPMLSSEDAAELLPLLGEWIVCLERLKEECQTDEKAEELARRLFRLENLRSELFKLLNKKQNAEVGREPEFVHSVQKACFPDSPVSTTERKEDIT